MKNAEHEDILNKERAGKELNPNKDKKEKESENGSGKEISKSVEKNAGSGFNIGYTGSGEIVAGGKVE